jgi:hypothetical protein
MTKLDPCRNKTLPRANLSNSQKSFTLPSAKIFENLEEFTRRSNGDRRIRVGPPSTFVEQMLDDSALWVWLARHTRVRMLTTVLR